MVPIGPPTPPSGDEAGIPLTSIDRDTANKGAGLMRAITGARAHGHELPDRPLSFLRALARSELWMSFQATAGAVRPRGRISSGTDVR